MKHFTWIGAVAVGVIAAAIYWTKRQPDLAVTLPAEPQIAIAKPAPAPSLPRKAAAPTEIMEPILVLPEWEIAPAAEPAPEIRIGSDAFSRLHLFEMNRTASTTAASPRPESGRDSRPWMPYAPEDQELSATRRLAWVKLSTQEPVVAPPEAAFEETAEPPLFENPKR